MFARPRPPVLGLGGTGGTGQLVPWAASGSLSNVNPLPRHARVENYSQSQSGRFLAIFGLGGPSPGLRA
eukprot:2426188-Pyramimonas_sp.AAC.1